MKTVTVTELARNLRQMLDHVEFQGEELAIVRNHHQIARIIPGAAQQTALEAMGDLYRTLPETAAEGWLDDSRSLPETREDVRDPWVS